MSHIVIAFDAGHGQSSRTDGVFDTGAVAGKEQEAERAFQLVETALFVCALPEFATSIKPVLTRDTRKESAPVGGRDDEAQAEGAQYFISVHLNSSDGAAGTETFYRDDADKKFAKVVQDAAVSAFILNDRGVKHESLTRHKRLAVLAFVGPACLWEAGFIENAYDMGRLFGDPGSRDRRIEFWSLVFRGLLNLHLARTEL